MVNLLEKCIGKTVQFADDKANLYSAAITFFAKLVEISDQSFDVFEPICSTVIRSKLLLQGSKVRDSVLIFITKLLDNFKNDIAVKCPSLKDVAFIAQISAISTDVDSKILDDFFSNFNECN